MSDIKVTLDNNQTKTFPKNTTYKEISETFPDAPEIIGISVNNRITSLADKCDHDVNIRFLKVNDTDGNRIYVAGLKMVFEYALKKCFPSASVEYSYNIPCGIVANIKGIELLNSDIYTLKRAMLDIVDEDRPIEKLIIKGQDGITYYDKLGNKVKSDNIQNIMDLTVTLYRLDNIVNYYYYEMPYSTGVVNKYEIKYLSDNKILISYPMEYYDGNIPEYRNYEGIMKSYEEGASWLNTMKVPYINDINREIYKGKITNFVKSTELNFNLSINEAAKEIVASDKIKYVLIAGPSSSGKTTVTKRIASYFEIYGKHTVVISIDDYFKERNETPKDAEGNKDYECVEAIDVEYLRNDVKRLLRGEEIYMPSFNFITGHKEVSSKKIKLQKDSIILFEGLHALNPSVLDFLPDEEKYKIYVSPFIPLRLDEHNYISLNDLRLIRRMVRDFRTRGASVNDTLAYWQKVRAGEEKYIIPYISSANRIINTSLPYEVGVLKILVEPLLYSVTKDEPYYNEARRLLNFLKQFFTINTEYVPKVSILREFIGGDNND